MKPIALILSMLVLFLTATPCCALEGTWVEQQDRSAHGCAAHEDCCTGCSPFYVCGTCTGFTVSATNEVAFSIVVPEVRHIRMDLPLDLPQTCFSIWQPPK